MKYADLHRRAFTLIELLIVVAIIAILAAIAVPNFLEAQVRAKVSRVQSDLRTIATGLEAYAVDCNRYPPYGRLAPDGVTLEYPATLNVKEDKMSFIGPAITTPVAYINRMFDDPFMNEVEPSVIRQYEYLNLVQHVGNFPQPFPQPWMAQLLPAWGSWRMVGSGPDGDRGLDIKDNIVYDPTNGTTSNGDVVRCARLPDSRMNTMAP
ncbi:prepilin-type N-terminal cleavage/methylation domain-containing protein [bacterium]|nr:prepilin-type N-terminal cleavage/methylation domain-containing protein [bacterium]